MQKYITTEKGYTHGGNFHADDVFAAAFLRILNPDIKITRGFDPPKGNPQDTIVFDIGGGKFDHHGLVEKRMNNVPYASFGKLWEAFAECIVDKKQKRDLDVRLVQPIDIADNGGPTNPMTIAINGFNPAWDSDEDIDECFNSAVDLAEKLFRRQLELLNSKSRAKAKVKEIYEQTKDKNIIIMDKYIPFAEVLIKKSLPKFVIFPSPRGGYNIQIIQKDFNDKTPKIPFPKSWWGANEDDLKKLTGYDSVKFCHPQGFMMLVGNKEDAISICTNIINHKIPDIPDNKTSKMSDEEFLKLINL